MNTNFTFRSRSLRSALTRFLPVLVVLFCNMAELESAYAWGKVGHDLSARVAAHLTAESTGKPFFKAKAVDLGYYANVPDLFWKKNNYAAEINNQHLYLDVFDREFKKRMDEGKLTPKDQPFELPRATFNIKFASIPETAGRALWRILELEKKLQATSDLLKQRDILKEERHRLQMEWLVVAGAIGHYMTNLAQPLNVTENTDGQLTEQKGLQAYFEESLVDELWPSIDMQVYKEADRIWEKERGEMVGKTSLMLALGLARGSLENVEEILKRDKKIPRDDLKKAAEAYRPVIVRRLAMGAVVFAELLRRHSNWTPNDDKSSTFNGEPRYIEVPVAPVPPAKGSGKPK